MDYKEANWNSNINLEGDIFEYLPQNCLIKSDRASMYTGLEIRAPFLSKKMGICARELSKKNKYLISKEKMFHRKLYKELCGKDYLIKEKKGFSFDKSILEKILKANFYEIYNLSINFLCNNGYPSKTLNKLSKKS